jgi:uncharacterized protein YceH (UPF0502 family)
VDELTAEHVRVLGCLLEKERTVPDSYPMTLNALVTACNQSTNRWPVVRYDAGLVQRTLDDLKDRGLVRFVHPSHGERTTKFRQVLDERHALLPTEAALLSVLFVRGPQTVAELRTRSERLHAFDSAEEVEAALQGLAERAEPLARASGRQWVHTFAPADEVAEPSAPSGSVSPVTSSSSSPALEARVAALEEAVAHLFAVLGEERPPPTL